MPQPYPANIPSNVSKDAKYSVISADTKYEVRLIHRVNETERSFLTTGAHPNLVDMVNAVKRECNGVLGGAFYINEFRHVLVPTSTGTYFAGKYLKALIFNFDGAEITAKAPNGLQPGGDWPGPHVGTRYKLKAGARDISYTRMDGANETEHCLSAHHPAAAAKELAQRLGIVKGVGGGRFYINEAREFFSPPQTQGGAWVYLGCLGASVWFPDPFPN